MKKLHIVMVAVLCLLSTGISSAQVLLSNSNQKKSVMTKYEDTKFDSSKSLHENLASSKTTSYSAEIFKNSTTLQEKITASKKTTVFVVSNRFFDKMKEEERDAFLSPTNRQNLNNMVLELVVPGRLDRNSIEHEIEKRNGLPITMRTLKGEDLKISKKGKRLFLTKDDVKVEITHTNFYYNSGLFHIVDGFLL